MYHISNSGIRDKVQTLIENYCPNKTETTALKMKIILSVKNLICSERSRRLSLPEEKVEKQIDEWGIAKLELHTDACKLELGAVLLQQDLKEFEDYCTDEQISNVQITTGIPRGMDRLRERIHGVLIPVLTKMSIEDPTKWFKHEVKMKNSEDVMMRNLLEEESQEQLFQHQDNLRREAKAEHFEDSRRKQENLQPKTERSASI
ncbi:hypothetical protein TNCV_3543621 [Trichonephila clavipes]|nr:hypothetical protein TNCV_3543621 [Trichonephila clavipes]